MISTQDMKEMYKGIQHQLSNLIPEKWESIYLYASVIKQLNNLETWEMYFYYVPAGLLKKNPINVYEIPNRFNVDEEEYLSLVDTLCHSIKKLHKEYQRAFQRDWTNVVIAIKDTQFLIEYNADNLLKSIYSSSDRHLVFKHKYLNIPLENFTKKEAKIIQSFLDNEEYKMEYDRYFEIIPKEQAHSHIEYERSENRNENLYPSQLAVKDKKPNFLIMLFKKLFKRKNKIKEKVYAEPIMEAYDMEPIILEPKIQILSDK
ncbi:MAG: DUF600 family protein [Clostridia bacterium]|nr:DUF600 family protein [Clostridia bacterium]